MSHNAPMAASNVQYIIQGVEPDLDRVLRKVAEERHPSLNQFLVQELQKIANRAGTIERNHEYDFAIGSMLDGEEVDAALASFGQVDAGLWQQD